MKLIRFGTPGNEMPGLILHDGRYIDASAENVSVSKGLGARHWAAAVA